MDHESANAAAREPFTPTWSELLLLGTLLGCLSIFIGTGLTSSRVSAVAAGLMLAALFIALRRFAAERSSGWARWHAINVVLAWTFGLLAIVQLQPGAWAYILWSFVGMGLLAFAVLPALEIDSVGPVSYFDVLRLTRRGRTYSIRVLYVAVLFTGLVLAFHQFFPQVDFFSWQSMTVAASPQQLAEFTTWFVQVAFQIQNAAILLLTPAYVAGAITTEKEQGTLALLFTTHLRDQEIVVGKLASRLVHLLAVLIAGLPLFSFTQLWGGVDLNILLANFTVSFFGLLCTGGIAIVSSVLARTTLAALLTSYAWVGFFNLGFFCLPLAILTSPIGCQAALSGNVGFLVLLPYCFVQCATFFITVAWAVARLRQQPLVIPSITPRETAPVIAKSPASAPSLGSRLVSQKTIGEDPILWKELRVVSGDSEGELMLLMATVIACILPLTAWFVFIVLLLTSYERAFAAMQDEGNMLFRLISVLIIAMFVVCTGFRAANTFCRERAQKTLESLLLLPISRWELLYSKWLGCLLRWRYMAMGAGGTMLLATLVGAFHPLATMLLALLGFAHVLMLASAGVWISLVSRTTTWANLAMAAFIGFYFLGGLQFLALFDLVLDSLGLASAGDNYLEWVGASCNPLHSWWEAGFSWQDAAGPGVWGKVTSPLVGVIVYTLAAGVFLLLAWLRLEAEGRRPVKPS